MLFAISVMAVALLGVASMFPAALSSVVAGGQTSKATMLAREMVEMMQADSFERLDTYYDGFDTASLMAGLTQDPPAFTCPVTPGALDYNRKKWTCDLLAVAASSNDPKAGQGLAGGVGSVRVDCLNPNGTLNATAPCPTELRQVTVTVAWNGQGARSVSLVTYVAKTE